VRFWLRSDSAARRPVLRHQFVGPRPCRSRCPRLRRAARRAGCLASMPWHGSICGYGSTTVCVWGSASARSGPRRVAFRTWACGCGSDLFWPL